jgi:hypothetical protein
MAEKEQQSRTDKVNKWVQTTAIIIAAVWGIYTFLYAQVLVPKSAPVNITVDLGLKKVGDSALTTTKSDHAVIPVEMNISAKNPSSRQVFLLPSFWIAYGVKIGVVSTEDDPFKDALTITARNGVTNVEKHVREIDDTVVGYGGLLSDTVLKPNETAARRLIFYVPPKEYDSIRVFVSIPTMDHQGAAELEYHFNEQDGSLNATMYRIGRKGERTEMKLNKDGGYSDSQLELQAASSQSELSLW